MKNKKTFQQHRLHHSCNLITYDHFAQLHICHALTQLKQMFQGFPFQCRISYVGRLQKDHLVRVKSKVWRMARIVIAGNSNNFEHDPWYLESLLIRSNNHVHVAHWSSLLLQYPYPLLTVEVHEALWVQVTDLKLPVLNAAAASPVEKGSAQLAVHHFQHQHLPLSFSFIGHMGRSVPQNQCDDIFSAAESTLHCWQNLFMHSSGMFLVPNSTPPTIKFMKVIMPVNPPPSVPAVPAPAATQRLSSPTTFWKVVPSASPPTTKPHSETKNFWAWKIWDLFQHKKTTMEYENIPPIHLLHFLRWKCTSSPEKFIIDPSDKARIPASWVHPKVKHAIPEIQRNPFEVSNIRLGYWEITSHHPGKILSMFQEDSFPKTLLKVRSFQIPVSQSQ